MKSYSIYTCWDKPEIDPQNSPHARDRRSPGCTPENNAFWNVHPRSAPQPTGWPDSDLTPARASASHGPACRQPPPRSRRYQRSNSLAASCEPQRHSTARCCRSTWNIGECPLSSEGLPGSLRHQVLQQGEPRECDRAAAGRPSSSVYPRQSASSPRHSRRRCRLTTSRC